MDQNTRDILTLAIAALPGMLAAFYAYKASQRSLDAVKKADATAIVSEKNSSAITEVGKAVDGLTTKLVDATKISSESVGREKEQAAQKAREAIHSEGLKEGRAEQKDIQVKAASGPEVPGVVSSEKSS